ncbi:tRNA (adenine(58)-N(1))-methyltransferase, mitochondrial [Myripristis murdjan]|uniref:tRNA (adenine(58)-N(1))-methyltransferase n=1 Tax=Myripristis murdjan TaxID=586833 RepID=A0A667ZU64_9TELE|nr:tRNA (adenine(58)-N(1))-methyltransferase, mitochondrial [Myripristis murdjan]
MAVQMPLGGALLMHRLVRICTSRQGHQRYRELHPLLKIATRTWEVRTFSAGPKNGSENEDEAGSSASSSPVPSLTPRQGLLSRRRPLSPLERISRLLPQDSLSPEVLQLRQENQEEPEVDTRGGEDPALKQDVSDSVVQPKGSDTQQNGSSCLSATLPGESLLVFGELLVAEYRKKGWVEFRKMFKLQEGMRLHSSWGTIGHDEIAGQPSGRFLRTHLGMAILVRRASLEDYVLYMKRGPAIAYPKDASSMLMMMDITEGDIVLESGSGSGAMSLFVSRAVGSKGKVLSVEVREDHHKTAVCNYNRWRASWRLQRGEEWPDNVCFHNADLRTASPLLAGWGFHSVALDLINPHLVLPTVIPHLHPGAVCAVYLANITQVIDLLEGLRCLALPLLCERIIEVPVRDWLVAPARQKNGRFCTRKDPIVDQHQRVENAPSDDDQEMTVSDHPPFGSVPYIARPHPEQVSHTAFLVKLRKYTQ